MQGCMPAARVGSYHIPYKSSAAHQWLGTCQPRIACLVKAQLTECAAPCLPIGIISQLSYPYMTHCTLYAAAASNMWPLASLCVCAHRSLISDQHHACACRWLCHPPLSCGCPSCCSTGATSACSSWSAVVKASQWLWQHSCWKLCQLAAVLSTFTVRIKGLL